MVLPTTLFVEEIRGVFVRLTTCKGLTNSLPKLSLITMLKNNQHCSPQFTYFQIFDQAYSEVLRLLVGC